MFPDFWPNVLQIYVFWSLYAFKVCLQYPNQLKVKYVYFHCQIQETKIHWNLNPAGQNTTQICFINYKWNRCYDNLSLIIYIWKYKLFGYLFIKRKALFQV